MPPAYEVLLLNTAIPQIQAAQSGDTYVVPRDIAFSAALTLSAGTANGVPYLNGSKVVTTGSALTFDGQTLTNTRDTPILLLNDSASSNTALRLLSTGGVTYVQSGISAGAFAPIAFTTNGGGSEQMRLTSTGLGIGTSLPGAQLDISTTVSATGAILRLSNQSNAISVDQPHGTIQFFSGDDSSPADTVVSSIISAQATTTPNEGYLKFLTGNNTEKLRISSDGTFRVKGAGTAGSTDAFQVSGSAPADAARITSGGDLLVGTQNTNPAYNAVNGIALSPTFLSVSNTGGVAGAFNRNSDGVVLYWTRSGSAVGDISVTTTSTAYNTSSDYRLKDNQQPLTNSGAFIDALQPKTWNWKADGSKGVGFIAHEVQEVSPGTVVGAKDAVDKDGKPVMQAMEYGSAEFIANIIAELQSLRARVAQLEAK